MDKGMGLFWMGLGGVIAATVTLLATSLTPAWWLSELWEGFTAPWNGLFGWFATYEAWRFLGNAAGVLSIGAAVIAGAVGLFLLFGTWMGWNEPGGW